MHAVGFKTLGGQIMAFVGLCILFGASMYYFLTTAFETGVVFAEKNQEIIFDEDTPILYALIHTDRGPFKIRFLRSKAPLTVENFIKLSEAHFYDRTQFHRVIKDYLIQGGDPLTKEDDKSKYGIGGPNYSFPDEINDKQMVRGVVAMANHGKDTNGSQFFILTAHAPRLQNNFTVFGEVVEGMDVVDAISSVPVDSNSIPKEPVRIKTIDLLEAF